jgi:mono/diheme cytochrome c family protein
MKQQVRNKKYSFFRLKTLTVIVIVCTAVGIISTSFENKNDFAIASKDIAKDSVESVKAFMQVYKVLMSPRCLNCHPAGDVPLQGDDSHVHSMLPKRGKDGKGLYAMKCGNCHQPENLPGLHKPPGNPNWHLPPANMKMVFEGKSPRQLAKQLLDPKQNGNKNKQKLLEHAHDDLVIAGWNMGEGRSKPPMSHEEFVKAWNTWIEKGAYAPK